MLVFGIAVCVLVLGFFGGIVIFSYLHIPNQYKVAAFVSLALCALWIISKIVNTKKDDSEEDSITNDPEVIVTDRSPSAGANSSTMPTTLISSNFVGQGDSQSEPSIRSEPSSRSEPSVEDTPGRWSRSSRNLADMHGLNQLPSAPSIDQEDGLPNYESAVGLDVPPPTYTDSIKTGLSR